MNQQFYANVAATTGTLQEVLRNKSAFVSIPADWSVIVADIQGSTKATMEGRGKDINILAAACVIACINIAKNAKIEIPFLYGGDGATILAPNQLADAMVKSLKSLRSNAHQAYGLRLRVGSVEVNKLKTRDSLRICKWRVSEGYDQALFLGEGLLEADRVVKADPSTGDIPQSAMPEMVSLNGMMCRWNQIPPKKPKEEIVCMIIEAKDHKNEANLYADILDDIEQVYGEYTMRHPVEKDAMVPSINSKNFSRREKLEQGSAGFKPILREAYGAVMHALIFRLKLKVGFSPNEYLQEVVEATDTLHVSGGTMYTIVSGTKEQRKKMREVLDEYESKGKILYGLAECPASIMTCYVERLHRGHHHFLDGAGGGYTLAAKEWKAKRAQ